MIYRKVKMLDLADAAYIAGLIDGEGTVTMTRRNRYKNRGLVVSISNNEIPILKHVQGKIGAGKITGKRITSERHAPSYTYCITNRQALSLLEQVFTVPEIPQIRASILGSERISTSDA